MLMLTGEYNHQLDAKNRIRIPSKLKKELGEEYYFTRGTNGCIAVIPKMIVDQKLETLMNNVKEHITFVKRNFHNIRNNFFYRFFIICIFINIIK